MSKHGPLVDLKLGDLALIGKYGRMSGDLGEFAITKWVTEEIEILIGEDNGK
jgi:hypothetical protein